MVLAINSTVLQTAVTSGLEESRTNTMEIKDFSAYVVKKMLQFVYNNSISLNEDSKVVEDLLVAADKYAIEKLRVCLLLFGAIDFVEFAFLTVMFIGTLWIHFVEQFERANSNSLFDHGRSMSLFEAETSMCYIVEWQLLWVQSNSECKQLFKKFTDLGLEITIAASSIQK